jgi:hypothetical protein
MTPMKASALIAKLQQFQLDSDLTEIEVLRLFDDDSVGREIDAKFERVQAFLASGDLEGLRKFIKKEKCPAN